MSLTHLGIGFDFYTCLFKNAKGPIACLGGANGLGFGFLGGGGLGLELGLGLGCAH
jgi:hypothetical protein